MRKLTVAVLVAGAAAIAGPSLAADLPYYPPIIEVPDVDYGYSGSFYLRGSAAWNMMWAREVNHPTAPVTNFGITDYGYGYSVGAGAGFETGTGLRVDATIDHIGNTGMTSNVVDPSGTLLNGDYNLGLRSTVVLANAYYDVRFGDGYSGGGGPVAYIGAGAGVAFNDAVVTDPIGREFRSNNSSLAAAGMVGLGYDFGQVVADVGYRALYINRIENTTAPMPFSINDNWVHEVRGTVRYRF